MWKSRRWGKIVSGKYNWGGKMGCGKKCVEKCTPIQNLYRISLKPLFFLLSLKSSHENILFFLNFLLHLFEIKNQEKKFLNRNIPDNTLHKL